MSFVHAAAYHPEERRISGGIKARQKQALSSFLNFFFEPFRAVHTTFSI